jgi:hypothetical protein
MNQHIGVEELSSHSELFLHRFACDAVLRVVSNECLADDLATQLAGLIEVKRDYVDGKATHAQHDEALATMRELTLKAYNMTVIDERIEFTPNRRASEAIINAVWSLLKLKASKKNPEKFAERVASTLGAAVDAAHERALMKLYPNRTMFGGGDDPEDLRRTSEDVRREIDWQRARLTR